MDLMVQNAIRELVQDVQGVQARLDLLERDRKSWARKREENDLAEMIEYLKQMESDVSILQADCVISMTQAFEGGNVFRVSYVLQVIFGGINILFDDVKTMKTELKDSYIQPADLAQLKIDWERFRKTIGPIEKSLQRRFEAFSDQKRSVFKKRLS